MKPIYVLVGFMLIGVTLFAQGIQFEEGLNWQEILNKAKIENKYIFVDCYTTWCAPCKVMEKDVYINDTVGKFFNAKFISVKAQMDRTGNDNNFVRNFYNDAEFLEEKYTINSYPTYIFLSPDGKIVHKERGLKTVGQFIDVGSTALTPGKVFDDSLSDYYSFVTAYKAGEKNYDKMPAMIDKSTAARDNDMKGILTHDYLQYLETLARKKLYTPERLKFISAGISKSSSPFFSLFYHGKKADHIMKNSFFSVGVADRIIQQEDVAPLIAGPMEPDWSGLTAVLKKKYNKVVAKRNVLQGKITWYESKVALGRATDRQINLYIKYFLDKIEKYGSDTTNVIADAGLNNFCYKVVFELSNDPKHLCAAIKIMEGVMRRKCCRPMGAIWDTYASLLYKAGRTEEGIYWEEKALNDVISSESKAMFEGSYTETLKAMKKGEKIW